MRAGTLGAAFRDAKEILLEVKSSGREEEEEEEGRWGDKEKEKVGISRGFSSYPAITSGSELEQKA